MFVAPEREARKGKRVRARNESKLLLEGVRVDSSTRVDFNRNNGSEARRTTRAGEV
jgi:hypothetical protein